MRDKQIADYRHHRKLLDRMRQRHGCSSPLPRPWGLAGSAAMAKQTVAHRRRRVVAFRLCHFASRSARPMVRSDKIVSRCTSCATSTMRPSADARTGRTTIRSSARTKMNRLILSPARPCDLPTLSDRRQTRCGMRRQKPDRGTGTAVSLAVKARGWPVSRCWPAASRSSPTSGGARNRASPRRPWNRPRRGQRPRGSRGWSPRSRSRARKRRC
jgi:hypothetical protein